MGLKSFSSLERCIIRCRRCPRLVAWREEVARTKTRRFAQETYWGHPVPGFGDPQARLLIIGLAPAAHGANRTGRLFTGDRSGEWLYRALYKAGFANQPTSLDRHDGLRLKDCYVTAAVRCAPPGNKPTPQEFRKCHNFLVQEVSLLRNLRVVVGLGKMAFEQALKTLAEIYGGSNLPQSPWRGKRPRFFHGAIYQLTDQLTLLASYHPSQQNTFTGKLTEAMWDRIFEQAKKFFS